MIERTLPAGVTEFMPRTRCLPVDTNVLLKNIARDVYQWPYPTSLRLLGESGALRLYAAVHVGLEVLEKLDSWMRDRGRDPVLARHIWGKHYLPNLWLVHTGTLGMDDPRVQAVLARDPDDAPTAALASVLGFHALSEDGDLIDYGLASGQPWLEVALAAGDVALGETADLGLALGVSVGAQTLGDVVGTLQSLASTPSGRRTIVSAGVVVAGLLLLAVLIYAFDEDTRNWMAEKAKAAGASLAALGQTSLAAYTRLSQDRFAGMTRLQAATIPPLRPLDDVARAARILATEPRSLTTKELARRLWDYKRVPTSAARYLQEQLSTCRAFVEIAPDEWQFGRRGDVSVGERQV